MTNTILTLSLLITTIPLTTMVIYIIKKLIKHKTMGFGAQLGMQAAGEAASGILGLALGGINDRRQLKQQGKLGQQQLELNKQMTDYQQMKQLEMWEKTGYGAQKEQMQKAGLNPALLYGMSGGGAQTIGGGAAGVGAPNAPSGGGEALGMIGMGIQGALINAQRENIEANTEKTRTETEKIAGVDTRGAEQAISASKAIQELTEQQKDNARWQYEILKLDKALKNIELEVADQTMDARMEQIENNSEIIAKQLQIIRNQADISEETKESTIKQIQREATGALLRNLLTKAQTKETGAKTRLIDNQANQIINEIQISWKYLNEEQKRNMITERMVDWNTDVNKHYVDKAIEAIDNLLFSPVITGPKRQK